MENTTIKCKELQWAHGMDSLLEFINHLNTVHSTIKFTSDISPMEISFLDLTVYIKGCTLYTRLHTKTTDRHMYLKYFFRISHDLKMSIPYLQFLRLKRIHSKPNIYWSHRYICIYSSFGENTPMMLYWEPGWKTIRLQGNNYWPPVENLPKPQGLSMLALLLIAQVTSTLNSWWPMGDGWGLGVLLIAYVTSTLNSWWPMGDGWGLGVLFIAHVTSALNSWWPTGGVWVRVGVLLLIAHVTNQVDSRWNETDFHCCMPAQFMLVPA